MTTKIETALRADRRVEDLSHDGDGWWCYLAHGLHVNGEYGHHLIHEDSLSAVKRQLRGISAKTNTCACEECRKALAAV